MKNKKALEILSVLTAMGGEMLINPLGENTEEVVEDLPREVPPPKGMKEYLFDIEGNFSNHAVRRELFAFRCYAINNKNAVRKYNKWKLNNL